jgi:hypothetical protein
VQRGLAAIGAAELEHDQDRGRSRAVTPATAARPSASTAPARGMSAAHFVT